MEQGQVATPAVAPTVTPTVAPAATEAGQSWKPVKPEVKQENSNDLTALLKERDEALARLREIDASKEQADRQEKIKAGKIEELQASWEKKYNEDISQHEEKIKSLKTAIAQQARKSVVTTTAADMMLDEYRHIGELLLKDRLKVEVDEKGEAKVLVLDADGKSTKGTVEELVKEIKGDNRYKKLVKGVVPGSGTIGDPRLPNLKQEPQLKAKERPPSVLSDKVDSKEIVKFLEARIANRRG